MLFRSYRCATVTQAELTQLRRIDDVVRLGRVQRITSRALELDGGAVPVEADTLFIDCSADGLQRRPAAPVFDGRQICLQSVRTCQQVFSAAFIAHVEAAYADDAVRNDLCVPVPHPDSDLDWLRVGIANERNSVRWAGDEGLQRWLANARLQLFRDLLPPPETDPRVRAKSLRLLQARYRAQTKKLNQLLAAEEAARGQ